MEMLDIIEKIVSIGCSILSLIIAAIALFKSNEAIRIANKIYKKQENNNISNSSVTQIMK